MVKINVTKDLSIVTPIIGGVLSLSPVFNRTDSHFGSPDLDRSINFSNTEYLLLVTAGYMHNTYCSILLSSTHTIHSRQHAS